MLLGSALAPPCVVPISGRGSANVHIGILRTCIFLNGCCTSPDICEESPNCGVFAGRMNEAKAALVDSIGRMRRDVIMDEVFDKFPW